MNGRQGAQVYVHVPRTRATVAAGLTHLNGTKVLLVRRATFDDAPCWVVDPPLVTTFLQAAQDPQGRELLPGHQVTLSGLPEAWMTARAPTWSPREISFLQDNYGLMPTAAIADELGRGLAAVRSKVEDLHLRCRTVWTPELDEIVRELFHDTAAPIVADLIGCSAASVRQRAIDLGVKKDAGFIADWSRSTTRARSAFTPEISEIIELLYEDTDTAIVADLVGIPVHSIWAFAKRQGWKRSAESIREVARARFGPDHPARAASFKKGHVPANKGLKGFHAPGCEKSWFKKGQRSSNWKPLGSYRINADGYLDRKVADTGYPPADWKAVHRLLWEEVRGPIPKGHVVRFSDGKKITDPEAITIDKLECITLRENALRNAWHTNMPPELRKLVGTRAALTRAINKRERELKEATP